MKIKNNLKSMKLFSNVFSATWNYTLLYDFKIKNVLKIILFTIRGFKVDGIPEKSFDLLMFNGTNLLTYVCFANLYKVNKNIKCAKFEEGILSYNNWEKLGKDNSIGNMIRKIFGQKTLVDLTKHFYCYYPSMYKENLITVEVPKINPSGEMKDILKNIFNLGNLESEYDYKYIYFSSVYDFEGGEPIGELELLKEIRDYVGNDNLLVKVHPRDIRNIYSKSGFNVDKLSNIPWEAIQLNLNCTDKVFITTNSGSVLSINMILNPRPRTVFTYRLCSIEKNNLAVISIRNINALIEEKTLKEYVKNLQIISSIDEL
jgi:hypothetical protein